MTSAKPTPLSLRNPPGLPEIRTRSGLHPDFLASLRRGLAEANRPGLSELLSRGEGDFTLAFLDACAAIFDNLAFHAEREANESYLRTAVERASLRAHARLIGYELRPAKSASVFLAFEAEPGAAPEAARIHPAGLQIRSIPYDGERPQIFETIEPLTARPEWNAMKPRLSRPQLLQAETAEIRLAPEAPRLSAGDPLLFLRGARPVAGSSGFLRRVAEIREGLDGVRILSLGAGKPAGAPAPEGEALRPTLMRIRAGFFGDVARTAHMAPLIDKDGAKTLAYSTPAPGSILQTLKTIGGSPPEGRLWIYLNREYPEIPPGGGALIRDSLKEIWVQIHAAEAQSVEAYGLSARVTRLEIGRTGLGAKGEDLTPEAFLTRDSTLYAHPEALPLADLAITEPVRGAEIELETLEPDLTPGRILAISGERADLPGAEGAEIRVLAENQLIRGRSVLSFTQGLAHGYLRGTVRISANLAQAVHGETVAEILGDGEASRPFQSFRLKSGPLSHGAARNPKGMAPLLEVRVNRVLWRLTEDLAAAGPEDQVYALRFEEEGGVRILFGDGINGARPPTGEGNIEAVYQRGAGLTGHVRAGQLSLLSGKPSGLKSVTNPLPPSGAADAEGPDEVRRNAPLKVLTLGRVVSLRDYEDFARGFAAVAKARADWTFDGFDRPIHLTLAGQGGALLPEAGEDLRNLRAALAAAGEADQRVLLRNYKSASFGVSARLFLDPAHMPEEVLRRARAALLSAFSFEARELGQGVGQAQIVAALQAVPGVRGVDLEALHLGATPELRPRLRAATARPPRPGGAIPEPAELLTIDPARLRLEAAS